MADKLPAAYIITGCPKASFQKECRLSYNQNLNFYSYIKLACANGFSLLLDNIKALLTSILELLIMTKGTLGRL